MSGWGAWGVGEGLGLPSKRTKKCAIGDCRAADRVLARGGAAPLAPPLEAHARESARRERSSRERGTGRERGTSHERPPRPPPRLARAGQECGRSVVEMTFQGGLASRSNPNRDLLVKLNLAGL